jgi:tetratricopeptide (TPR) repeat protein
MSRDQMVELTILTGGFPMKRFLKVIPFLAMAILVAVPAFGQSASISGKVLGRDGQPAQGIVLKVDSLSTNNGRLTIRESLNAKTGRNGEYSLSGLYNGRVMVSVIENGVPVLIAGEKVGDEIFLADGLDKRIPTFDLSKAPAPSPTAAAAANNSGLSAAERDALKKKLEEEAKAAGEASKAFDAGKAAFTAKDYPESIKQFKLAAEKNPSQDVIWANLGRAYDANKEYDEAIGAYQKAIAIKAVESNYFLNLSLAQIGAGKIEDSKVSIEKAASLNPLNAGQAYYNLAAVLINRNKGAEAIDPLKKAIELDPKYGPAYFQLGLTYVGLNKLDEAPPVLQKCLDLGAGCPDATTAKALIDTLKAQAPTTFTSPEAKAKAEADAKAKNQSKTPAAKAPNR